MKKVGGDDEEKEEHEDETDDDEDDEGRNPIQEWKSLLPLEDGICWRR